MIIDFHNHFYPSSYLDAIKKGPTNVGYDEDADGNPVLHYPGDYNVAVPGHRDAEYRSSVLERHGVDRQVLTFTSPGTHIEEPGRAVDMARRVNDQYSEIIDRYERFLALATLPLNEPDASVQELDRAVTELGLPGAMLFSNVNGVPLADERYFPLYEKADSLGAVLYIHPIHPVGVEAMTEYWLMPLVGFVTDTTLAAAHLVFAGVPERWPNVKWVLAHLGGTIPYLAERLDRGYEAFEDCRADIPRPPSTYLKRFYYDTVNFDPGALRLALDFAGADHILAGSDYPHMIGSIPKMLESIRGLELYADQEAAILGGNAARILGVREG